MGISIRNVILCGEIRSIDQLGLMTFGWTLCWLLFVFSVWFEWIIKIMMLLVEIDILKSIGIVVSKIKSISGHGGLHTDT